MPLGVVFCAATTPKNYIIDLKQEYQRSSQLHNLLIWCVFCASCMFDVNVELASVVVRGDGPLMCSGKVSAVPFGARLNAF